jgi:hypothetical protein
MEEVAASPTEGAACCLRPALLGPLMISRDR